MAQLFSFRSTALPKATRLLGFRGKEGLSRPYRFDVFVEIGADEAFDPAAALWASSTLSAEVEKGPPFEFHGIIASAELVYEYDQIGVFRVVMVPRLWQLSITRHSRVFTKKKIPDVLKDVLEGAGVPADAFELSLDGSYEPEEHVCQYKESDLDFISRWMEHEGIHYFFEQTDAGDKLVIRDVSTSSEPLREGPVPYRPVSHAGEDASVGESFASFVRRQRAVSAKVKLQDYDYAKPALDVSGEADAWSDGVGEIRVHGARFFKPGDGKRLAGVRAEELLAGRVVFHGVGWVMQLRPGYSFELEDHPRAPMNTKYLTTEIEHACNLHARSAELAEVTGLSGDVYRADVTAILLETPFRPERRTPWPRVQGFEIAVVDGPADDDYAQLDADGRYNVKFSFDESDLDKGKASTFIRMMQPHAGNPEGFHFPLRKGTEVMIAFVSGDPDRPIIAGVVPNAENPSPVTSSNHTRNIVHTGGDTHIELEDDKDNQWVDIRTPPKDTFLHLGKPHDKDSHYITLNTGGDTLFEIGSNQDVHVGGKLTEKAKGAVTETYKTSQKTTITGPQTTTAQGPVEEIYGATQDTEVTGLVTENYAAGQFSIVTGGLRDEKYKASQKTTVKGMKVEAYLGPHDKTVGGKTEQKYDGFLGTKVGGKVTQKFGSTVSQDYGPVTATYKDLLWDIPGGADLKGPSITALAQASSWFTPIADLNASKKTEQTLFALGLCYLKAEAGGLAIAGTGVKVEVNGVTVTRFLGALGGFVLKLTGGTIDEEDYALNKT
jgi:type VI secretion system secreted protein VgrG